MNLLELLQKSLIKMDLGNGNKFQIIEELLDVAVANGQVSNRELALKDLIEREQYLSTGFENGLAVPHAKTEAVREMVLVFGLNQAGIEFDSLDGKPTRFVFLLLSPVNTSGPHIQILALLARNFQNVQIVDKLKQVTSEDELFSVFQEFK